MSGMPERVFFPHPDSFEEQREAGQKEFERIKSGEK
jgi:hypothetical protein